MQKKKKFENMPTHVAMIMDGNRRWATRKGLNKLDGHKAGGKALKNLMSLFGEPVIMLHYGDMVNVN